MLPVPDSNGMAGLPGFRTALLWATDLLAAAGIASPRHDAEVLAAHVLGISRAELKRRSILGVRFGIDDDDDGAPSNAAWLTFQDLVRRRAQRVPLQHLTGLAPFRRLELRVGPGVFIPRPETELLVEAVLTHLTLTDSGGPPVVVDLGTGSGAIAIAVATEIPRAEVFAVELDRTAHGYASQNVAELAPQVRLVKADARTALPELNGKADAVVSNPPYIPWEAIPRDPEANQDPGVALYGLGANGLAVPEGFIKAAARLLKPGGLLVMEHGDDQGAAVRALVARTSGRFTQIETHADLTGRPRFVTALAL
ncbi:MAG: peptide chain release factor N(5)-glutamine methyltransferase [Promicromonosporaceae bacterium]|nr:peptide chain release factor N(5)-glutamine methyltransferase [Promicromonosporaceae bacterium]